MSARPEENAWVRSINTFLVTIWEYSSLGRQWRCRSIYCIESYHSDDDLSFGYQKWSPSDHQCNSPHCWILSPFHALDKPCISSSWLSQIPSFRQETCQAYYRNDPVKYDLAVVCVFREQITLAKLNTVLLKNLPMLYPYLQNNNRQNRM